MSCCSVIIVQYMFVFHRKFPSRAKEHQKEPPGGTSLALLCAFCLFLFLAYMKMRSALTFLCICATLILLSDAYCTGESCKVLAKELAVKGIFNKQEEVLAYVSVISTGSTGRKVRGTFFPLVDEFSRMELQDSVQANRFCNDPTTMVQVIAKVAGEEIKSEKREYFADGAFVPYYGVIIRVRDGRVTNITWDDTCDGCTSDGVKCVGKSCGLISSERETFMTCEDRMTDIKVRSYLMRDFIFRCSSVG